jgi:hypothetical protein
MRLELIYRSACAHVVIDEDSQREREFGTPIETLVRRIRILAVDLYFYLSARDSIILVYSKDIVTGIASSRKVEIQINDEYPDATTQSLDPVDLSVIQSAANRDSQTPTVVIITYSKVII